MASACASAATYLKLISFALAGPFPLVGDNNHAFGSGESFLPSLCTCLGSVTLAAEATHCCEGSKARPPFSAGW